MKQLFIFLLLFIGVTQTSIAMEVKPPFISLKSQQQWVKDIRTLVAWSYDLNESRETNNMVAIYVNCKDRNSKLQNLNIADILSNLLYKEEVQIAENIFYKIAASCEIKNKMINEIMDIVTHLLAEDYEIKFPNKKLLTKPSKEEQEKWNREFHIDLFKLNQDINPNYAAGIIAGTLLSYKFKEEKSKK